MTIKFKYYKAIGEKAEAVKAHIKQQCQQQRNAQLALQEKYGFDGIRTQGCSITGLIYKKPIQIEHLIKDSVGELNGEPATVYRPNRRFREGKALASALRAAKDFDFSDYACTEFKVKTAVVSGQFQSKHLVVYNSVSGIRNGDLIFRIPYTKEEELPAIPAEFIEISKAEFLGENS